MTKREQMTQELATTSGVEGIRMHMEQARPRIEAVVPAGINLPFDRIVGLTMTACRSNPKLLDCTPVSVLGSVIQAVTLGLEIGTTMGECYIIPYGQQAQFQMGYKGYLALALRSHKVKGIYAAAVRQEDDFDFMEGDTPFVKHKRALVEDRGPLIAAYMVAHLDGLDVPIVKVIGPDDIARAMASSQTARRKGGPWDKHPDAMWAKTAILRGAPFLPKSLGDVNLQALAVTDQATDEGRMAPAEAIGSGEVVEAEFTPTTDPPAEPEDPADADPGPPPDDDREPGQEG